MAITDTFDPMSPEVITAAQMMRSVDGFPHTMIVTFQPNTFSVLLGMFETQPLAKLNLEEDHDTESLVGQAFSFEVDGQRFSTCLSPVGAPTTVALLEQAVAQGTRSFVVFGTCGALVPNLPHGGVIVPTEAYRDEGTSYHYAESSDYISIATADRTASILANLGIPHAAGRVWTTDAFFRETKAGVAKRVADGCLAVDMEASAMAAFAQFRNVEVYQFLYTADNLADDTWDPRLLGTLPAEPRARYVTLAVKIAREVTP